MSEKRVGDLKPFRDLRLEIQARAAEDSKWRGDADPIVKVLSTIDRRLEAAIQAAEESDLTITIDEYAEAERITRGAAYKRFQAGAIPGAEKRPGLGVVIPADYATRSNTAA